MFKDKLYSISKDLDAHHRSVDQMMSDAISSRLDLSLHSYMDAVDKSYNYLRHRGEIRVLEKVNRGLKRDDKSTQ
jgi:hypothetical protein